MLVRHVVPLLPAAHVWLLSATPPESTLPEVFILNSLNFFRMNTSHGKPPFAQFWCNVSPFRINTCKSASKQTTLTPFRMNTYEKTGGAFLGSERSNLQPFNVPTCFRRPTSSCISIRSGIHVSQLSATRGFEEGGIHDKKKSGSLERSDSRAGSCSRLPRSSASDRSQRTESNHSRMGRSHKRRASA